MRKPILYGRFALLDRIAVGGMAEVFVAVLRGDPTGKLFALKRILPTLAADEEFITMFLDEARLVVQLDHPAIVPIQELGKLDDRYYIAMDYQPGKDLRALLDRLRGQGERIPVALAVHVAARVADALDHAHRKRGADGEELRVVHRDVSPANVLLGFDGSVRVIDFGIAQAALRTRREDSVLRGKFGYMSPEMVCGHPVDRRSDVFALGVVLHEMLTGARLFAGKSELSVLERVRRAEVPPPSLARPEVPPALDAVVLRALAREPDDRFAWSSELRDALLPFAEAGVPPGDPPALARLMAISFPRELRSELDRIERARNVSPPPAAEPSPERTQVIAVRPGGAQAAPPLRPPVRQEEPPAASRRPGIVATLLAGGVIAASLAMAMSRPPVAGQATPHAAAPAPGTGRVVVQARVATTLVIDGVVRQPLLAAGEVRALDVPPGEHRVELRTEDGRRAGATVHVKAGETSELLGVAVE